MCPNNETKQARAQGSSSPILAGRTVALAVTGSIAAYKAVQVARLCVQAGAKVLPLMTASATRFVGPVTLAGICGEPVHTDMWDAQFEGELHVAIASRADVLVIVPATADVLARLATGRADDLVTATALCARGPVLVAPAMHPNMWTHPAVARNVRELREQGRVSFVGPVDGVVASGESGVGRMAEPEAIVRAIADALGEGDEGTAARRDLVGKRIVVTAGPTYEAIDPVRFLGNRSSGKMGFSIAARAAERGAEVVLVAGPTALETPPGVRRRNIESTEELRHALDDELGANVDGADVLVMAAAVADFRPAEASATKIKKREGEPNVVALVRNPDLLSDIGHRRRGARPVLVGFALETGDDATVLAYAQSKLTAKKVDFVVANAAHESLGRETNRIAFVGADGAGPFLSGDKTALADALLDRVTASLRA